ncbi:MAG: hypothetical protein ACRDFS_04195 [Chloroflexota bacterium]
MLDDRTRGSSITAGGDGEIRAPKRAVERAQDVPRLQWIAVPGAEDEDILIPFPLGCRHCNFCRAFSDYAPEDTWR